MFPLNQLKKSICKFQSEFRNVFGNRNSIAFTIDLRGIFVYSKVIFFIFVPFSFSFLSTLFLSFYHSFFIKLPPFSLLTNNFSFSLSFCFPFNYWKAYRYFSLILTPFTSSPLDVSNFSIPFISISLHMFIFIYLLSILSPYFSVSVSSSPSSFSLRASSPSLIIYQKVPWQSSGGYLLQYMRVGLVPNPSDIQNDSMLCVHPRLQHILAHTTIQ